MLYSYKINRGVMAKEKKLKENSNPFANEFEKAEFEKRFEKANIKSSVINAANSYKNFTFTANFVLV